jgi:hypothetical protein
MNLSPRFASWLLTIPGLFLFHSATRAATPPSTPAPLLNDAAAGRALAADLRNAQPSAAAEFKGLLKIRARDGTTTVLTLLSKITPGEKSWQSYYQAVSSNWTETLVVRHAKDLPNEYRYSRQEGAPSEAAAPPVCQRIWQPFAGSDYSLADLGLEFFHWPHQVLIQNEMRKSRPCHVLESSPATTNGYARIVSWVDVETGGLVMAEAYDAAKQRVKEFEVKRFKKSGEQWQLQEMEIRQLKDHSRTIVEFDVPDK